MIVSLSNAKAEFRALAQGVCEGLWMKITLDDLKKIKIDNKSIMNITPYSSTT